MVQNVTKDERTQGEKTKKMKPSDYMKVSTDMKLKTGIKDTKKK